MIAPARPDWRHARIAELLNAGYSHVESMNRLRDADPLTVQVYNFLRANNGHMGYKYPNYLNAHELYNQRPWQRGLLEAMIVGGSDNDRIKQFMECDGADIDAYCAMYFDVRDRKALDICGMLFQGAPHKTYHAADRIGVLHRLAWFGKSALIEATITQGISEDKAERLFMSAYRDIVRRQLPEIGMGIGAQAQFATEYLKIADEWDEKASGRGQDDMQAGIEAAMRALTVSVADPTIGGNLEVPVQPLRIETEAQ